MTATKNTIKTCIICDDCCEDIEYGEVFFTDSVGNKLCRDCARKMMIDNIDEQLDTYELYELFTNAGFTELERHTNE